MNAVLGASRLPGTHYCWTTQLSVFIRQQKERRTAETGEGVREVLRDRTEADRLSGVLRHGWSLLSMFALIHCDSCGQHVASAHLRFSPSPPDIHQTKQPAFNWSTSPPAVTHLCNAWLRNTNVMPRTKTCCTHKPGSDRVIWIADARHCSWFFSPLHPFFFFLLGCVWGR